MLLVVQLPVAQGPAEGFSRPGESGHCAIDSQNWVKKPSRVPTQLLVGKHAGVRLVAAQLFHRFSLRNPAKSLRPALGSSPPQRQTLGTAVGNDRG